MGFCKDPQVSKENRVLVGVKRIRVPFRIPQPWDSVAWQEGENRSF
jgi:hypothetical protein